VRKSHGSASVRAALERDGADPVFLGGSEFAQFFIRDLDKYIKLVKQAGVKAEQ
jgi:tripartite-type tricarboxylate transporter receptor subunit TctC